MAPRANIQTVRAEFLDPSLYDDSVQAGLPRLRRGALLAPLSHAFDLAENRRPGHALRVAYIGIALADELHLDADEVEDVYFACLLHDVGMSAISPGPRIETGRGAHVIGGTVSASEMLAAVPSGTWSDVIEAMTMHCELGQGIVRRLGLNDRVAHAVAHHHDCWDGSGPRTAGGKDEAPIVARIVAAADRLESMIDAETSPLIVRRRGPQLVREMAGSELDPAIAARLAAIASRDEFWLAFYDNDLAASLMGCGFGDDLDANGLFEVLGVLSDVVDARNSREVGRGRRVADLARRVALRCDIPERRADLVKVASLLQDIGTLGVPIHILGKPDILSIEEMSTVQMHPLHARDIVSEIPGFGAAAWWVACHHERVDGKGYPGMLEGDEVPMEAQVIGVCEAYEALTSDRPYRRAMSGPDAMEVLRGLAGTRFSPSVLGRFESIVHPLH